MDSSVKYQKFTVSGGDDKIKPESKNSRFLMAGLVLVAIALVAIAVTAVAIGVGVGVSSSGGSEEKEASGLTVITITEGELEGEYYGSSGGIHFQVTVNNSYAYLSITTARGEPLVTILQFVESSMSKFSVRNTNFLMMMKRPGYTNNYGDYVIPENCTDLIDSMMMEQEEMTDEVLQRLDNKTVNETSQSSLEGLAMSQEAVLIIEAAKALGDRYMGPDYPATVSFYVLAITLSSARQDKEKNIYTMNGTMAENSNAQKRSTSSILLSTVSSWFCDDKNDVCYGDYEYYQHPDGDNDCFGLCGPECCCWRCVCGSCCAHRYCRTHDQCCKDNGFFSLACFRAGGEYLFGIDCTAAYDCY